MDRGSDLHGPRVDNEEDVEQRAPVTAPPLEGRPQTEDDGLTLAHEVVLARSEIARHLRGSIFPAGRDDVIRCATEENAPAEMLTALETLPDATYYNVEGVWEGLGGRREHRLGSARGEAGEGVAPVRHFDFRFDRLHRIAGAPFLVSTAFAGVSVDPREGRHTLRIRFGWWLIETSLDNVESTELAGPFTLAGTVGPARLGWKKDLVLATNRERGLRIRFRNPVRGIDPFGVVRHPAVTVTVDDVDSLQRALDDARASGPARSR